MITIHITSGIGNQLFQLCFGQYISDKYSTNKAIYIYTQSGVNQLNLWDIFIIKKIRIERFDQKLNFNNHDLRNLKYLFTRLVLKANFGLIFRVFNDKSIHNLIKFDYEKNYSFFGYWQKRKYLKYSYEKIIEKLKFKKNISLKNCIPRKYHNFEFVGLHIRGGDYLKKKNKEIFISLGKTYYKKGINKILAKVKKPLFLIFTDDINHSKRIIKNFNIPHLFIEELNKNRNDDFQLLSQCCHYLIPNSTFSFWAILFSINKKTIVMPKKWFKFHNQDFDIDKFSFDENIDLNRI